MANIFLVYSFNNRIAQDRIVSSSCNKNSQLLYKWSPFLNVQTSFISSKSSYRRRKILLTLGNSITSPIIGKSFAFDHKWITKKLPSPLSTFKIIYLHKLRQRDPVVRKVYFLKIFILYYPNCRCFRLAINSFPFKLIKGGSIHMLNLHSQNSTSLCKFLNSGTIIKAPNHVIMS
uniref:Uncharacterized protein n=1 Tax=Opuntia streptacantha TaxID=393608 RepID=A0A7C9ACI7_OPUST